MKGTLRRSVNSSLSALSEGEIIRQGRSVQEQLLEMKLLQTASNVCVYVSFRGEVDTQMILNYLFEKKKNVFIPLIQGVEPMKMYQIHDHSDLEAVNVFKNVQILQPRNPKSRLEVMDCTSLDVVIVPGVAFDEIGCRLGRGKGYYDSFLQGAKKKFTDMKTVGLGFTEQQMTLGTIPMDKHDQRLDYVLFPKEEKSSCPPKL